jgi:hypothetical protein
MRAIQVAGLLLTVGGTIQAQVTSVSRAEAGMRIAYADQFIRVVRTVGVEKSARHEVTVRFDSGTGRIWIDRGDAEVGVEILEKTSTARNLCERVVADQPLDCPSAGRSPVPGVAVRPLFETATHRVSLVTLAGQATIFGNEPDPAQWVVALSTPEVSRQLQAGAVFGRSAKYWRDGVLPTPVGHGWSVRNAATTPISLLTISKKGS